MRRRRWGALYPILQGLSHFETTRVAHCLTATRGGIVKLLGLMPSPDSRGRRLGSMLTDRTLRQFALSP
jgi:hypothetical protein